MLSRKIGERIVIADNITVTVLDIDRGKIRLGVEAPADVPVHREELVRCKLHDRRLEARSRCPECVAERKEQTQ